MKPATNTAAITAALRINRELAMVVSSADCLSHRGEVGAPILTFAKRPLRRHIPTNWWFVSGLRLLPALHDALRRLEFDEVVVR
jgi:hypothetical protein